MQKKKAALIMFAILALSIATMLPTRAATEEEIENAIVHGIEYLASQQNLDGSWGSWDVMTAYTGLALMKLQMRAHELGYDSPFDPEYPYADNVIAGWQFIFSYYTFKEGLSVQDHTGGASGTMDDPDTNGNGYGIRFAPRSVYSTGICLMALAASGTPDRPNDGGMDFNGDGFADTFKEIAQDTADWLAWAQGDSGNDEGGWAYEALNNQVGWNDWTDNSNGGYATLGLAAAEGFGCTVPDWVRTEVNVWIATIQDPVNGDPDDGGSWYNPDWPWSPMVNELKGGNLIFQMTFYGDDASIQRFDDAMDYISRHWQDMNHDPGWGYGVSPSNYQAMFCLMKGFEYSGIEIIDLDGDGTPEHDWYEEFATVLVGQQNPDGSWYMGGYGGPAIDTCWALLTLEKIAPPPPVIDIYIDIKPGSWPNPLNLGSRGVFAVAICGTADFDVMTVNASTIKIYIDGIEEGVAPLRWTYEDAATPYTGEAGGGHDLSGDGYLDLVFHFDIRTVIVGLELATHAGETVALIIKGSLNDSNGGIGIAGQDYALVLRTPARKLTFVDVR